ncbi:MAG: TlpA family protein disulfide reductase [Bacteroidaceae bacterium]|nr:TlpA family protein disulfide reductase [Bacteroidaceae bacterium]
MKKTILPTLLLSLCAMWFASCGNPKANESTTATADTLQTATTDTIVYEHDYLVKAGDTAPDFTLPTTDGTNFTLSEQRGKVVMLQFTASWCGVCRKEMPHIESQIWQRHKNNADFVLIGIDREETKDVVDAYTQKVGTTYPMALDTAANVFASYALRQSGITRNVLINRDGRIVKLTRLFNEEEFNSLVHSIDSLLAK